MSYLHKLSISHQLSELITRCVYLCSAYMPFIEKRRLKERSVFVFLSLALFCCQQLYPSYRMPSTNHHFCMDHMSRKVLSNYTKPLCAIWNIPTIFGWIAWATVPTFVFPQKVTLTLFGDTQIFPLPPGTICISQRNICTIIKTIIMKFMIFTTHSRWFTSSLKAL